MEFRVIFSCILNTWLSMLFLLISFLSFGAGDDKAASAIPWYNQEMLESPFLSEPNYIDTTITGFQLYDYFLPGNPFYASKGNVGHIARPLLFGVKQSQGFGLFSVDPYQQYRFMHENLKFYRPKHVFSELFYVTGANREQLFYGMHSQRFHERLVAGFNYRLVNSPGEHSRMGARNSNVYLTLDFKDANDRYQLLASFIVNRFENQQSGGLKNHLAYEENPVRDSVFLYNAISRYRETAIHLNHFYRTGFYVEGNEAGLADSLAPDEKRFINLGRINHHFSYQRRAFVLDDGSPPAGFYPDLPKINTGTYDSTWVDVIKNQLSWSNFPLQHGGSAFPFNFKLAATHRLVSIYQPQFSETPDPDPDENHYPTIRTHFNQLVPEISVSSDKGRFLSFQGYTRMTLGGYNDEDLDIGGSIYIGGTQRKSRIIASALFSQQEAPFFQSSYIGNYVSWDQSFEKMNIMRLSARLIFGSFSAFADYYVLNNMVYLGKDALPLQNADTFSAMAAGMDAQLGRNAFQSRHRVAFQYFGTDQFEQFPELISYHSLYADVMLFKKAMHMQAGFDLLYNTPYKAMSYMPVVWQYYSQDAYTSGHTILADIFITAQVKRTRFLLKLQNVAGMLTNSPPVYTVPFYPLPETAFKFGISWMFFN